MLGGVAGMSLAKLLPDAIFGVLLCVLFVESHNVDDGLGVPFLFLLRDTSASQDVLPFTRKTLVELVIDSRGDIETRNNLR
jgi:hypothetical protein